MERNYREVLQQVAAEVNERYGEKPKVALVGCAKGGKSSLLNALLDKEVVLTGMRTDEVAQAVVRDDWGIEFTDGPGMGTEACSLERGFGRLDLEHQHLVIHVLNATAAITEEVQLIHEVLRDLPIRVLTVVNKVDLLDSEEQRQFTHSLLHKLNLPPEECLFVSTKRLTGVDELLRRMAEALPGAVERSRRERRRKEDRVRERRASLLVYSNAALCAAVAAVPVPFSDVMAITPMQVGMVVALGHLYGIPVSRERAVELMATFGAGMGMRSCSRGIGAIVKRGLPAVNAALAFAGTVAVGKAAVYWFRNRMQAEPEVVREVFRRAVKSPQELNEQDQAFAASDGDLEVADGASGEG